LHAISLNIIKAESARLYKTRNKTKKQQKMAEELRQEILQVIGSFPQGHKDDKIKANVCDLLDKYHEAIKAENGDGNSGREQDVVFQIGTSVYGYGAGTIVNGVPSKKAKVLPHEDHHNENTDAGKPADPIVDFAYMKAFMKDVFLSYDVPEDRAEICSDVLIEADFRGIDSHGLGRLKPIYCDRMDKGILFASKPIDILKETDTTALVDGNLGLGLYIGPHCMQMAIDKAKKHGVGFVAVKNSTHYGIAGYYVTMATQQGCVGLSGTNARPSIAPTFGVEPMLGTNPLCFGIPTNDAFPFVIDCATSVNQRGKIEKYSRDGVATPRGVVIDNEGVERTDTDGILRDMVLGKCALTPMGGAGEKMAGYKGYGWATTVELLSTAFQSGPFGEDICGVDRETGKPKPMPLGHYFLAIDVEAICPIDEFTKNASSLLKLIRESKKSPLGPGRIWTAGEPENDARVERTAQGGMKVVKPLQENMKDLRDTRPGLKEKYGKLPFEE
jgi:L-2-hydroxycarboxylate dehydrogenase (NAD+)